MNEDPIRRVTFRDDPVLMTTTPPGNGKPPPARFDADPDVSAEIAVDRDEATAEEAAWVEWLREEPIAIPTGDVVEVTLGDVVEPGKAVSHFIPDDAPTFPNEDGSKTTLTTTQIDPRSEDL